MSFNIEVQSGSSVRLPTSGKYCDRDIVVTATGGVEDLDAVLTEQETLIEELKKVLEEKKASGGSGGSSDLPAGYSRCDYIQFSGEQWVDTGIIGNQDTQVDVSFTWGNSVQNHLFGCISSDNTASITSYMNGSWRFGDKSSTKTINKNNTVLAYAARINKSMIGVTGSMTSISDVNDFETVGTMLIGGARSATGAFPSTGFVGRVFYFRIWDGDEPVLRLIPVTDGTVFRFYDMISKSFFDSITETPLEGGNL